MRRPMLWPLGLSALVLAAGCMSSPLNNDILKTQAQPILFEGYHPSSNREIQIFIQNQSSGAFEPLGKTQVNSADMKTDSQGVNWYRWSTTLQLPAGSQYWVVDGGGSHLVAKVKATDGFDTLTSFGAGGPVCWQKELKNGGFAVMKACGSQTPVVALRTSCGGPGQPSCCTGGTGGCSQGDVCIEGKCKTCGGANQPCCTSGSVCKSTSLVCIQDEQGGSCKACGFKDQHCCGGNACKASNLVCQGGKCTCGGPGQACCTSGSKCGTNLVCKQGFCAASSPSPTCSEFGFTCISDAECCQGKCMETGSGVKQCCSKVEGGFCKQ